MKLCFGISVQRLQAVEEAIHLTHYTTLPRGSGLLTIGGLERESVD